MSIGSAIGSSIGRSIGSAIAGGGGLPDTMTIELASGVLYARFAWDSSYDLVQRFAVTSVSASATANGCVQPTGLKRIPVATARNGMIAAYNAAASTDTIAGQTDDAPPVKYNNTFIGGNHGANFAKKITAIAHGKTIADIGSQWVSGGGVTFYIIRIVDADTIWVLSNNTSGNSERWAFNTTLAAPGALTHVAGATNTAAISFTASVTQQIYPCVQDHTRRIYRNGVSEITADGVYDCNFVTVVESYGIANTAAMLDFLIAGRPWASEPALNDNSITTQVTLDYTYTIRDNGSVSVEGRFENLQSIDLGTNDGYVGFVQAQPLVWNAAASEQIWYYVPRVNTVGSLSAEPTANITASVATTDYVAATWKDSTNPPDRMVQLVKTSAGVNRHGYAIGYSRLSGAGAALDDYIVKSGFITSARKMYTHCLTKSAPIFGAPASTLPANSVVSATAYRIPYNLQDTPEATTKAVRLTDDGAEIILDFHQNVAGYAVPVPSKLDGKSVSIVDSNGNLALDSSTVAGGEITVTVTGGYGAAVLKVT